MSRGAKHQFGNETVKIPHYTLEIGKKLWNANICAIMKYGEISRRYGLGVG